MFCFAISKINWFIHYLFLNKKPVSLKSLFFTNLYPFAQGLLYIFSFCGDSICDLNQSSFLHLSLKSSYISTCSCFIATVAIWKLEQKWKNVEIKIIDVKKCKCEENKVWKKIIGVNNAFKRWLCFLLLQSAS